jgi:uncharacterized protein YqeY
VALKAQLENDIKTALLGGDRFVADVLRNFKAVILNEEVAQGKRDEGLGDDVFEQLIAKELKKRAESASLYDSAGRPELADNERAEAEVLAQYQPAQISEDDIKLVVEKAIADLNAGPQMMGQVIGVVKKELGNAADGAVIARIVKETLN